MAFQINTKKIAKNTITLYIRQIITMFISFFTVRVTLNQLGVEDYGLNNLVGSIVSMFSFINGSMGTAVQRFYSYEIGRNNQGALKRIFGTGLYLHLIVALITLVISEVFAFFLLERMNIPHQRLFAAQVVFQISIFTLILGIVTVPYSALLRSRELFSKTALIEVIQAFLRLANLSLLVFLSFDKLIVLAILNFIVSAAGILAFVLLARKFEETHTYPISDKTIIRQMLKFVSLLLLTVLSSLLNTQGIVMLINIFFGLTVNAAYAIAVQVQNAVNTFVTNFKSSMVPQIMASYGAGDFKSMHTMINIGTKITFVMLLMVTYPLMFSAQWILTIWLKNPPEYSAMLVVLTLVSINISSFTYFHGQGIHASGSITKQQIWLSSSYLGAIVLTFILFKIGVSFYSAIFVNMGIGILQNIVNVYYASKCFQYSLKTFINTILLRVFPFIVVTLCIFLVEYRLTIADVPKFIVVLSTDIIIVPILSFVIVFNKHERSFVHTFLLNKFSKV
ncbi:MATE family efflux transporter [Treponema vincentii]|uniref:MATE family efflux transporter n=1 Tax=Treponema vincentii TaxID=69710 RepID=UPI0020A3867E|nr:MATE family efflux transporter [Treponema vincentii]UTC48240.1 oligosaccharide flippase family protein [Treponema vincentii]